MFGEFQQWKDRVVSSVYHIYLCISGPFEIQKLIIGIIYTALGLHMGDEYRDRSFHLISITIILIFWKKKCIGWTKAKFYLIFYLICTIQKNSAQAWTFIGREINTCKHFGSMFTIVRLCNQRGAIQMKRMKNFMMTGWLKNSREVCFGGNNDEEFEDFKRAAFVLTIIKWLTFTRPTHYL